MGPSVTSCDPTYEVHISVQLSITLSGDFESTTIISTVENVIDHGQVYLGPFGAAQSVHLLDTSVDN